MPAIHDVEYVEQQLGKDWTFIAVEVVDCKVNWLVFFYKTEYSGPLVDISDSPEKASWIVVSREGVEDFL